MIKPSNIGFPNRKKAILTGIGGFVIFLIAFGITHDNSDTQTVADSRIVLSYDDKQNILVDILNGISSDIDKFDQRFKAFATVLSSGDITAAIRTARRDEVWLRRFTYKSDMALVSKTYKNIDDEHDIKTIEDLVEYSHRTNTRLSIYYDDFLEWVDNQKPSLVVEVQDSLERYQLILSFVIAKLFELGEKYDLAYDEDLEHWQTKESIEADKIKKPKSKKKLKKVSHL